MGVRGPEGRVRHGVPGIRVGQGRDRRRGDGVQEAEGRRQPPAGGDRRGHDLPAAGVPGRAPQEDPHERHDRTGPTGRSGGARASWEASRTGTARRCSSARASGTSPRTNGPTGVTSTCPGSMTTCRKRTGHRAMDGHDPKCATFRALPAQQPLRRLPCGPGQILGRRCGAPWQRLHPGRPHQELGGKNAALNMLWVMLIKWILWRDCCFRQSCHRIHQCEKRSFSYEEMR